MRTVRLAVPILALVSLLAIASAPASAGSLPSAAQHFIRCVRGHQGGTYHAATPAEARACAPASPQITRGELGSLTAGSTAILVRDDGSAALVGKSPSTVLAALTAGTCYDTWANPMPWGTSGLDFVQINVHGYGNHCGYANVPAKPTVYATCYVVWCSATIHSGRYDSNQGLAWFNDRRAAGWANIYFNIGDTWFCRGYVDTNGNPNSPQWCS